MLTVADRGEGGIKFAKILLTSYVNAPIYTLGAVYKGRPANGEGGWF